MSDARGMPTINTAQTGYIVRLVYVAIGLLVFVHVFGTVGYMILTEGKYSWFDAFYMTFITVATIGYGEIIDMSSNQPARMLTVVIGTGAQFLAQKPHQLAPARGGDDAPLAEGRQLGRLDELELLAEVQAHFGLPLAHQSLGRHHQDALHPATQLQFAQHQPGFDGFA